MPPSEVFNAVAEEMARSLDAHNATVAGYEADAVVIAKQDSRMIARVGPRDPSSPRRVSAQDIGYTAAEDQPGLDSIGQPFDRLRYRLWPEP
jgi:hypothetical protein